MMTKRIIIRIIVAVAVAFILSKFKLLGIMSVSASSLSTNFTYNNAQITQNPVIMNFTDTNGFAYGYSYGEFKASIFLEHSEFSQSGIDTRGASLKQAFITLNNNFQAICDVGSPSNPLFFSQSSNGTFNFENYGSTLYTIKCNVDPSYSGIKTLTLVFNRTSSLSRLSVGPVVTFTEDETTSSIKDLQNEIKKQNETCHTSVNLFNKNSVMRNSYIDENGNIVNVASDYFTSSDFIPVDSSSQYTYFGITVPGTAPYSAYYDSNKSFISSFKQQTGTNTITTPSNAKFIRFSVAFTPGDLNRFQFQKGSSASSYEPYGEICKNKQDLALEESQKQTQAQNETNDYLKSDEHSEADSEGASFFNDFGGNNHGISGVVTAPLRLLNSLTTASCNPLTFPLPFVNEQITLPCMRGIYQQYFGVFFTLWQLITTGLISYNVSLNIYSKVRAMQNPNNDRIEVLNL